MFQVSTLGLAAIVYISGKHPWASVFVFLYKWYILVYQHNVGKSEGMGGGEDVRWMSLHILNHCLIKT